jgi:hypothetical protein
MFITMFIRLVEAVIPIQGHAIAQEVSLWLPTAAARVQTQV